jgi:2,3-bisphosphoglycerate-dependent phosphoglycerate mutase
MSVGITVGSITDEIGAPSFVHAFFSTISAHCEPLGWGSRYPYLMHHLYQGCLSAPNAMAAIDELHDAKGQLLKLPPTAVVWDIEDRSAQPPWGRNIAPSITSLGNYFVSSTGRDLFELLEEALAASSAENKDAVIG